MERPAEQHSWSTASSPRGLVRSLYLPRTRLRLGWVAAILATAFGIPALYLVLCGSPRSEAAANILIAASGVALALFQWRQVQREEAWEHNTARLDKVNEFFADHFEAANNVVPVLLPSREHHYVYLELDLLEHALNKYHRGLDSAEDVAARIHTFAKRSQEQRFRQLVPLCLAQGSYNGTTHRIARLLLDNPSLRERVSYVCERTR